MCPSNLPPNFKARSKLTFSPILIESELVFLSVSLEISISNPSEKISVTVRQAPLTATLDPILKSSRISLHSILSTQPFDEYLLSLIFPISSINPVNILIF